MVTSSLVSGDFPLIGWIGDDVYSVTGGALAFVRYVRAGPSCHGMNLDVTSDVVLSVGGERR